MDSDMLVLDTLSATIVALTMPAFLFGFATFGHYNRKALAGLFKNQFKPQERAILITTALLGASTALMVFVFSFDALSQFTLQKWVQAMCLRGALGFAFYFLLANLGSELFCYFAVIQTVSMRRSTDWDVFFTLSLKPRAEQNILKPLIEETEKNRLHEELLDTVVMDNVSVRKFDDVSFDYSQAPSYTQKSKSG